jgi:hypothetical protein
VDDEKQIRDFSHIVSISSRPSHLCLFPFLAFLVDDTPLTSSREDPSRVCPAAKTFLRTKRRQQVFPSSQIRHGRWNCRRNEMAATAPLKTSIFRFRF